jgi:hypothetical protein
MGESMAKVELKSIVPVKSESTILFSVTVEINGEPQKPWYTNDPAKLLDFGKFRLEVAKRTGYYLGPEMAEGWEARVGEVWADPEELPKGRDLPAGDDDSGEPEELEELSELFEEEKKRHEGERGE